MNESNRKIDHEKDFSLMMLYVSLPLVLACLLKYKIISMWMLNLGCLFWVFGIVFISIKEDT